jgi:oligopeptide transport system substrate-binding protein
MMKIILAATAVLAWMLTIPASAEMVWNRGNTADPETLDPHKASTTYEAHILRDLFEGLVMPDSKAELIPGAAENWSVSADGTVYTFKIRPDAVWSNGDQVTADDFVYGFRRLEDPATAAEYASMLYVVKNAEEVNSGKLPPESMGVRAIDATTLEISLNTPTPYFLQMLTHQSTYPVHKQPIESLGSAWTKPGSLVSNGPFTLSEWVPNDHIRLVRNPKFHDAENVRLDAVVFYPTQDRSAAIKRFQAGELDSNDELPVEQLADLRTKFGDQVHVGPYLGVYYCFINLKKDPWTNPKLRRAISLIIDREFLANSVWGGSMIPAYGMVAPGISGYASYEADYAGIPQIDREDMAKDILDQLGYGPANPLKLELRYDTSENNQNTAVAIQEQLRPFGIEVSLLNTDAKTHFSYLEGGGDFDFARSGWIGDYKDPETFLGTLRRASGNNLGHYESADFERLMDAAAATGAEPEKRMRLLGEAERELIDDVGILPLLFYSYQNIVSSKLRGWKENVMDVHPSRFVTLDR